MKRTCLLVLLLAGCATSTGVVPIGDGVYMLAGSEPGASGGGVTAGLYREANAYCAEQKKTLATVSVKSRDAGFGRKATAELQFRCVEK